MNQKGLNRIPSFIQTVNSSAFFRQREVGAAVFSRFKNMLVFLIHRAITFLLVSGGLSTLHVFI